MHTSTHTMEILAPAGDMERLDVALAYGANAVYLGGHSLSLRAGTKGFDRAGLTTAIAKAHAVGAKINYCLNLLALEDQLEQVRATLTELAEMTPGPDALIIADPGVLMLARQIAPHIPIHLSTQANCSNSEALKFWTQAGAKRIVLARELDCKEITRIRQELPDVELEAFVHGAMCMAVSGRCHLSGFLNNRCANLGACTHPCRFEYRPVQVTLEEKTRPGEPLWDVELTEEWTRFFSAQDLCLVNYMGWFHRHRFSALKIEGRMKTTTYVAQVVDVYATAAKDIAQGTFRPRLYMQELLNVASRPLSTGFFLPSGRRLVRDPSELTAQDKKPLVGRITEQLNDTTWKVAVKAGWDTTQPCHILQPGLLRPVLQSGEYTLENDLGEQLPQSHPGLTVTLRSDHPALKVGLFIRGGLPFQEYM